MGDRAYIARSDRVCWIMSPRPSLLARRVSPRRCSSPAARTRAAGRSPTMARWRAPDEPTIAAARFRLQDRADGQAGDQGLQVPRTFRGDYDVDLAGNISLPLIGEVEAANLTTAQLDDAADREARREISRASRRQRRRSSRRPAQSVTVDGAVKRGGSFPVVGPTSLMQAVALAKGTSEDANRAPRRGLPHHRRAAPGAPRST